MGHEFPLGPLSVIAALIAVLVGAILLFVSYDVATNETTFWHPATHEIGFALIVAVVIWVTFEVFSQSAAEQRWRSRIEDMSKAVFMGVSRRRLPEELVTEVTDLIFGHKFIRDSIHINYTITDHSFTNRSGNIQGFVCLNAIPRIKQKNVSDHSSTLHVKLGLPNPLIDEMKPYCKVNKVTVKIDNKEQELRLGGSENSFRIGIKDDSNHTVVFDVGEFNVHSGRDVEIFWDYTMAKEEDTEVFQTILPLRQLNVTIIDTSPQKRIVRARSIHRLDMNNDTSAAARATYSYSMDKYFLPHQGFAIW